MKNGTFKKLLSMVLAMSFLLSLGFTAAFADGEGDEGVEETVISHVAVQEADIVVCANPGGNISVEQSDVRATLTGFQKYSDKFVINTPYGNHELSLAELLNFNEKGVNFRIVITDTALEIYANGELFRSIPLSQLNPLT